MEFIGKAGWAAPRLKDAALSLDRLREGYVEVIIAMRTLYQKCKLVHGDLSEYNILYFEGNLYIIDVSQAVDLDHPHLLDFLREDCLHVSDFFKKNGVAVMTIRELFDFIVDSSIADEAVDIYLEEVGCLYCLFSPQELWISLLWLLSTYIRCNKKFWPEETYLWRMKLQTLYLFSHSSQRRLNM